MCVCVHHVVHCVMSVVCLWSPLTRACTPHTTHTTHTLHTHTAHTHNTPHTTHCTHTQHTAHTTHCTHTQTKKVLKEHRIRFLSFLGIATNARYVFTFTYTHHPPTYPPSGIVGISLTLGERTKGRSSSFMASRRSPTRTRCA